MSRLPRDQEITPERLRDCDVLVIKTPTSRYSREEVAAVVDFVRSGGGLLMIGDHTNVFNMGTYLNDVARNFGFTFRHDLLFSNEKSPYEEAYRKPAAPHPIVEHLPPTDFAVSCSVDPGRSWGRAVVLGTGLWSLPSEYHIENYHPFPQHRPEMRYGPFVQLWATRAGRGRVVAFTDSTIFSNFCIFQPGKAELMFGMVEWLNHKSAFRYPGLVLAPIGALLLAAGAWMARRREVAWLTLLGAGLFGWVVGGSVVAAIGLVRMPVPEIERPMTRVVIDRTTSNVPLGKGAYVQDALGFGMFEQWIGRLGYLTMRRSGSEAFSGDALVVLHPSLPASDEFRRQLVDFVARGGRLLVVDSSENTRSTANNLLWPFGLSVIRPERWKGEVSLGKGWPTVPVDLTYEIAGGEPIAWMGEGERVVGARTSFGEGQVTAISFGSVFYDNRMGEAEWMTQPDQSLRERYDVLFAVVRSAVSGDPIGPPPVHAAEVKPPQLRPKRPALSLPKRRPLGRH
jgi:hypothetical protein